MTLQITTPHDEILPAPDTLTTLAINYLWRRRIAAAVVAYFEPRIDFMSEDIADIQTVANYHRLLLALYDEE